MGLLDAPITPASISSTLARNATKNLFDARTALDGWYVDAGGNWAKVGVTVTGVSALIPVTPGQVYAGSQHGAATPIRMHCFYAADGLTIVAGGSTSSVATFTAPAGAAFVRVTYVTSGAQTKWLFQLESGASITSFVMPAQGLPAPVLVPDAGLIALEKSPNLFDPAEALDGYYMDATGNLVASAGLGVSGFIPVEPGGVYRASEWVGYGSGSVADNSVLRFTTFFDSNKAVAAGGSSNGLSQINVPAGVYFIRVTYYVATANGMTTGKASLQIERVSTNGGVSTKYQPFGRRLSRPMNDERRIPQSPMWGRERLRMWQAWKRNPSGAFNITFHGDSYTDGNYFCKKVRAALLARGFNDGGPGWCGFWNGDVVLATQSIDTAQLSCAFTTGDWTNVSATSSWGPSFTHVVSTAASKTITVTAGTALASCTVVFKTQTGGAGFTWAINGGSTTSVSTNAATGVGTAVIDTSGAGASFTITITASGAGVQIAGLIGRKAGSNLLTVNKAGLTGSHASMAGKLAPYQAAAATLTANAKNLKFYMWSVNDQNGNILPSVVKGHIQNLVNFDRSNDPYCDLVFMAPPETSYSSGKTYLMSEYEEIMYQLARENEGAAFVGLGAIFGRYTASHITAGLFHADSVHPGTVGEWLIADQPLQLLA